MSLTECLVLILKLLETVNLEEKSEEMQKLAQEAKRTVEQMQEELLRKPLKRMVELVKSGNLADANELLQNNFPAAGNCRLIAVKKFLMLAYCTEWKTLKCVFDWVKNLGT